ncbi:hypothetical protein GL325_05720 [Aeromicrobium sp. 636]|uniref:Uncharacterized protein n=1 Tax=Aeromicrobium senzhongii TaxID=2663859 RepID=A0A8I0EVC7_9ACTN|nr:MULTISPECIES: hypothetical protein [Aeromicrobium]MBC9225812.1 hypothetical protein [Aeromicrobium senzhongii]MCQ3997921.1 hypothetical protein [Aeromicrobium sp. 636]MTB87849.1 hypothetical protein [Aeromicrobium senzhongii]QNL95131.1 hypothetical protein H9L21_04090 [Aeromicrobium senzhongii]
MTEPIRRPVSQLRAGDLIAPDDGGTVYVVCAISQPVGTSRRAEVVDARTGEADHCVLLPLHDAVLTVPGRARWVEVPDAAGDEVAGLLVGPEFPVDDAVHAVWEVEIDLLSHPGWEELVRGARLDPVAEAA